MDKTTEKQKRKRRNAVPCNRRYLQIDKKPYLYIAKFLSRIFCVDGEEGKIQEGKRSKRLTR